MGDLPKVVKTQETIKASENPDRSGECHPMNTGRPGVFIAVPEHIHALIGVEGGAMVGAADRRVTVLGYVNSRGRVEISDLNGNSWWENPNALTAAPKRKRVTLEVDVPVDVDPDTLVVTPWDHLIGEPLPRRIVAMDGEEVDHE